MLLRARKLRCLMTDYTFMSCIVCNTPSAHRQAAAGDFARFDCPRCGSFALSGTAEAALPGLLAEVPLRRSLMSHTLRRMQRPGDTHLRIISSHDLPTFWTRNRLPTPLQTTIRATLRAEAKQSDD